MDRKHFRTRHVQLKLDCISCGVSGLLRQSAMRAALHPPDTGRKEEIDINTFFGWVIRTDAVIGGQLWESARAARPFIFVIDFFGARTVVIGIVEAGAVGKNRLGARDGVVQHLFHVIPVMRVARHPQQISRDFELSVGATRGFKAGARLAQTLGKQSLPGFHKRFVWPPSSCCITLFLNHTQAVRGSAEVFFITENQISLHSRTQCIDVTVGVLAGKGVVIFRQSIVIVLIDKSLPQIAVALVAAALIGKKEILGQGVGFIPCIGDGLMRSSFLLGSAQGLLREMRQHCVSSSLEHLQCDRVRRKFISIDKATASLVKGIARQAVIDVEPPGRLYRLGKSAHQAMNFFLRRL